MPRSRKKQIVIGVSEITPFVIKEKNSYTGFEIELWQHISKKLKVSFEFKRYAFANLLGKVKEKKVDVAIGGITRTEGREKLIDFSHLTLRSGQGILTRSLGKISTLSVLKKLFVKEHRSFMSLGLLIFIFASVSALAIYYIEAGTGTFDPQFGQGFSESLWWAFVTITTVGYGDFVPQSLMGRAFTIFVVLVGYTILGIFIAKLASVFTVADLRRSVKSIGDLANIKVATKRGTIYVEILQEIGAKIVLVDRIEKAYELLDNSKVEAVLFDEPALLMHFKSDQKDRFSTIIDTHAHQSYGFAFPRGSTLRKKVNIALLQMYQSGEYEEIYKRWFGNEEE